MTDCRKNAIAEFCYSDFPASLIAEEYSYFSGNTAEWRCGTLLASIDESQRRKDALFLWGLKRYMDIDPVDVWIVLISPMKAAHRL